jgi:hypothetical protein
LIRITRWLRGFAFAGAIACAASPALALDKQGSAHGGAVTGDDAGFGFSGSFGLGVAFYNPTYAARPDNTGHALMRYTFHADIDLIGRRLSIPVDLNVFSDRKRDGILKIAPSELDVITGLTSTWELGPGAIEFGARVETDQPVDRGSYSQTYVDLRSRYLFDLDQSMPGLESALGGGDITGSATLGVFAVNPTYAARPDNSGKALLRYGLHGEISFWHHHAAFSLDGTMFTDRETNGVQPTELDLTPALIARFEPYQVQVAYERDMPIDGKSAIPGYTQSLAYVLAEWAFDTAPEPVAPAPPAAASPPSDTTSP